MRPYWFRPKRFWKCFAAYYPSSWQGWLVTAILAATLVMTFLKINGFSHSVKDTLIGMALPVIVILLVFDFFCFRTGEYPSWWERNRK